MASSIFRMSTSISRLGNLPRTSAMARGTMTLEMLGTEPIFNSRSAPRFSRLMTKSRSSTLS